MKHSDAIARLREGEFVKVCCDGRDDHHNCDQSACVIWQHCEAPDTLDVQGVVYLCFDPRHPPHQ
jgi:hypothetical protein